MQIGNQQIVSIRQFRQRLKEFCEFVSEDTKNSVIVMRHSTPVGVFVSKKAHDQKGGE